MDTEAGNLGNEDGEDLLVLFMSLKTTMDKKVVYLRLTLILRRELVPLFKLHAFRF